MPQLLRTAILNEDPSEVVSKHVVDKVPFVFGDDWDSYRRWRRRLASLLDVDCGEIAITGSAASGFSLSPNKNLKPFAHDSDIDVAIVSERHFSEAWRHLRRINLFTETLNAVQRQAIKEHQQNYVYWGCIATDKLLAVLPFAAVWLDGLKKMSLEKPTVGRSIKARIYRDFEALYGYQRLGIVALKNKMLTPP